MRIAATLTLSSFLATSVSTCMGYAVLPVDDPCCTCPGDASAGANCCQVTSIEAPATLPAKEPIRGLPLPPVPTFMLGEASESLLAAGTLSDSCEWPADRSPPRLYLRHSSLLI